MAPWGRPLSGFTLLEVLVVLTVLGVLAAFAIPSFLGARRRAYDAAAIAYLRQAVAADEVYASEHGGYATDRRALMTAGLRAPLPQLDLVVLEGGERYCLMVRHRWGTRWYAASTGRGLYATARPARSSPGTACP